MKNLSLLFLCEALSRTASLVMLSSMALIGQRLTPNPALATLPLALAPVATMINDGARGAANAAARPQDRFRVGCCVGCRRGRGGVSSCVPGQFRAALFGWVGHWCGQRLCHLLSLCGRRGGGRGFSQSRHFAGDGRRRRCRSIGIQSGGVVAGVVSRLSIRWLFFGDCRRSCASFAGARLCLLSRA